MSFRARLAVFFLLIVAIPIAAIAVLVTNITGDSADGKADARLSTGLETAIELYEREMESAQEALDDFVRDPAFQLALNSGDSGRLEQTAKRLAGENGITALQIEGPGGESVMVGGPATLAAVSIPTTGNAGEYEVNASTLDPERFVNEARTLTGLDAAVVSPDGSIVSTNDVQDQALPEAGESGDTTVSSEELRAASSALADEGSSRVTLFTDVETGGFFDSRPRIALIVAAFLFIALTAVAFIGRTLQGQIATMLDAARRIGSGDFSRRVPVVGRDEMAGLATEFNSMSDRLEQQIEQLRRQRTELDRSVRRLGEAFAAGLDRDAMLRIVAETAVGALEADYARVVSADGAVIEIPDTASGDARDAAIAAQKRASKHSEHVEAKRESGFALAAPVMQLGSENALGGVLAVGRQGRAFEESEREVFLYLLGQASASIENIASHEKVSEQAVTDELTGLPNNRAFRETMDREASRAERFNHELSLIVLDVDNFKRVNDTYGHLQGDEVLRVIGRLLQEEPRAIDEPARYGGEEFVVALPETGKEGAEELADRIREALEAEVIPLLDGSGDLKVTASFGTATLPAAAATVRELFAAADEALYEAKRSGKNRVVTAPETSVSQR